MEISPDKFDPVPSLFFFFYLDNSAPEDQDIAIASDPALTMLSPPSQPHHCFQNVLFHFQKHKYCFLRKGRDLFCDTPFQVTLPSPGPNCNLCSRNSMIFVQVVGIFLNSIFIYSYCPSNFVSLVFFWEWFLGQEWESVICKFTLICSYSLAI